MALRDDWARRAAASAPLPARREMRSGLATQFSDSYLTVASPQTAGHRQTAAVELAAGMLGRVLATAKVIGAEGITPTWLRDAGRDMVRRGEHLSRIAVRDGRLLLLRQSSWSWHGPDADAANWTAQTTESGPSNTSTRWIAYEGLVHLTWATEAGTLYNGQPATDAARLAAITAAATELSMGREAAGDVAKILTLPEAAEGADSTDDDDNDDSQSDPHAGYRSDLGNAKGATMLVESTANVHDLGGQAPARDWVASRLGPEPPPGWVEATRDSHHRLLAALGVPVGLATDADGTSQREGLRRWWMTVVEPTVSILEYELTTKLDRPITLELDNYAMDMVSRASVVAKLVQAGAAPAMALAVAGIER